VSSKPPTEDPGQAPPDSQALLFFNRAAQSGDELRKTLVSLSVAGIGVFFVALTGKEVAVLKGVELFALVFALFGFAASTACGLRAWHHAGRAFHEKATRGDPRYQGPDHFAKNCLDGAMAFFFGLGIAASLLYLVCRIVAKMASS
jgi:hypothetical protein